jgi:hypothetical protein
MSTAAVAPAALKLCKCGCGKAISAKATWASASHAARAMRTAGYKNALDGPRHSEMVAPMAGSCAWCETAWNGTAAQVLAAQAKHRETCTRRPAETRFTLEQRRTQKKTAASAERERKMAAERQRVRRERGTPKRPRSHAVPA